MNMQSLEQMGIDSDAQQEETLRRLKEKGSPVAEALGRLLDKVRAEKENVPKAEPFVITPQMRAEAVGRQRMLDAQLGEDK
ncbi:hypothetical protein AUJ77_02580 [Candidatus Nomurabacteria bacterium CG1_02_43_90]|uniref:Uncharacterized protein n=1 Tax=Candidatus Nomurabacteria bacterium CG1_02_43_90 TaxID=1805281 RepID=A0A1J4V7C4_9BACT|nr:MAG: hypothetical protein AUJ77_02580 [Candidatus Nomurabacteria bacterium CG1_02_43_90]